jgi:predicted ATPase/DNA-binding SARP family transcriptional activator
MGELRFGLLGPFEARLDGRPLTIPGAAERALLALLLLSPGRAVPATSLIDRLWAESSLPTDPVNALQLRVSKLRRALAPAGPEIIQRVGMGYLTAVDPSSVDAELFEQQVRRARAELAATSDPPTPDHLRQYDEALGLWRGDALADFTAEAWAVGESVRLEELRRAARVERARVAVALGRHEEVISDLEPLLATDPTQEAMAGLLMLALYRSGRQADALEVFTRTRTLLDEELGLEPSASLRSLHERVLRQDDSLGATGDLAVPPAPSQTPRSGAIPSPRAPSNLPSNLPPLIGREDELTAVRELAGSARLVTLVGPGGAGKTALGLDVALRLVDSFPDGAFVVRLAPVREPDQIPGAVADALGIPQDGATAGLDSTVRLFDYLTGKRMLLLVDNCEHLVDAVATFLDDVLSRCPGVSVVATSREALAVPGEVQYLVGPLSTPLESDTPDLVADAASVRLMLRRVTAIRPGYQPVAADLVALGRIARALDGMPLALELAAARVASMSLPEIADRIDQRFALLTSGPRTAEDRQRTLRATVDWSYDLLDDVERRVFDRLAVFHGGWSLRAAEAVVTDRDTDTSRVLHAMGRLVEQSLVMTEPGEVTRYRMLETLREYAADRLAQAGETDELARRHARYFVALTHEAAEGMRGHDQRRSAQLLREAHANVRAAIDWLSGPDGDHDEALRLAGELGLFWHQGRHVEGREILRRLLDREGGGAEARACALQAVSLVERPRACIVHPDPRCADAARESLATFNSLGDAHAAALSRTLLAVEGVNGSDPAAPSLLVEAEAQFRAEHDAWGLAVLGFIRMETALKAGEETDAVRLGRTTTAAFRELDDLWGLSDVLYHLGWGLRQFGRYAEAARTLEEAIDVATSARIDNTVQWALADLGVTQLHLGNPGEAADAFERAERASAVVGDRAGVVLADYGRGLLAQQGEDWTTALAHFGRAVSGFEALGTPVMIGQAVIGTARAHEGLAEDRAADDAYRHAAEIAAGAGEPSLSALVHEGLARLAAAEGEMVEARRLRDQALRFREQGHRPAPPLDVRDIERLDRALLDPA